ncbi:MAG: response regulator [Ardenticatenaceae bacterium]|nr:response regulator [Ardenticatenaceae bacterium]MCB9444348.1 response regulator [Ardenticatenaceae bacterium]
MLLLREGYELYFAADGYEALAELDDMESEPDTILSDVMMPDMDGFELCQRLKRHPRWRYIPIILVTALDSKEDLARGLESGADDFLNKPVNGLELRARLRSMLRIKQQHDELRKTMKLREDLSNMIVHDLRAPLANILVYCDLLEDQKGGGLELETIREEANRVSSFVTDMLLMAKMEHGRFLLNRSVVNMNNLIGQVDKHYQALAEAQNIDFTVTMPDETLCPELDETLFQRMVDNLLSNAFKFSAAGGQVRLIVEALQNGAAASDSSHMRLQVVDEGPGVPAEFRERIFDKFQIVASGRRDIKQVGLGLAFCKMVADAHNGRIYVTDNQPRGAIFTVEI